MDVGSLSFGADFVLDFVLTSFDEWEELLRLDLAGAPADERGFQRGDFKERTSKRGCQRLFLLLVQVPRHFTMKRGFQRGDFKETNSKKGCQRGPDFKDCPCY